MHGNLEPEEKVWGNRITVYSTEGCFYCEQMKLLMDRAKLSFTEIEVTDNEKDAFIAPQPYNSWTLNETTCLWEAPVNYPDDGKYYAWNEETTSWDEIA